MKKIFSVLLLTIFNLKINIAVNTFAKWTTKELVLDNGIVQRTLQLPSTEGSFITTSYKPVTGEYN